jgi:repressor LexA
MTRRQADVFRFIKGYIATHDSSPTYSEIAKAIGLNSLATVHKHIHCLKAEGRITLRPNSNHSIEIVAEPADLGRFEFEESNRLWDRKLKCYWVREVVKNA